MKIRYKLRSGEIIDIRYDSTFLEEDHPREENGRFKKKYAFRDSGYSNNDKESVERATERLHECLATEQTGKAREMATFTRIKRFLNYMPAESTINGYTRQSEGYWGKGQEKLNNVQFAKILQADLDSAEVTGIGEWQLPRAQNYAKCTDVTTTDVITEEKFNKDIYKTGDFYEDFARFLSRSGEDIDRDTAEQIHNVLLDYTDDWYEDLKVWERSGVGHLQDKWELLNGAIDMMPKAQGKLWRGTAINQADLDLLKRGAGKVRLNGVSSFSSDINIASEFADYNRKQGQIPVVFETDEGVHRGTVITQFSKGDEGEILMHAEATFEVNGFETKKYTVDNREVELLTVYLNEIKTY